MFHTWIKAYGVLLKTHFIMEQGKEMRKRPVNDFGTLYFMLKKVIRTHAYKKDIIIISKCDFERSALELQLEQFFFFLRLPLLTSFSLCFLFISIYYYLALVDDDDDDIDRGLFVLCSTFPFVWSSSFDLVFFHFSFWLVLWTFSYGSMFLLVRSVRRWSGGWMLFSLTLWTCIRRIFCFLSTKHQ